jgi:hypothetical protein
VGDSGLIPGQYSMVIIEELFERQSGSCVCVSSDLLPFAIIFASSWAAWVAASAGVSDLRSFLLLLGVTWSSTVFSFASSWAVWVASSAGLPDLRFLSLLLGVTWSSMVFSFASSWAAWVAS